MYNSLRILRLSHTSAHMARAGLFNQSSKRQLNHFSVNYCHLPTTVCVVIVNTKDLPRVLVKDPFLRHDVHISVMWY